MEYEQLVDEVEKLPYIRSREKADAAIKAVMGTITASVDQKTAEEITSKLPPPLKLENLHPHQAKPSTINRSEFIENIQEQFDLSKEDASHLLGEIISWARVTTGYHFELLEAVKVA